MPEQPQITMDEISPYKDDPNAGESKDVVLDLPMTKKDKPTPKPIIDDDDLSIKRLRTGSDSEFSDLMSNSSNNT